MSVLLMKWINQDIKLSEVVKDLEGDFADGYKLGELLWRLELISEREFRTKYHDPKNPEDDAPSDPAVSNLSTFATHAKGFEVKCGPKVRKEIQQQKPGTAVRVVYAVKVAAARLAKARDEASLRTSKAPSLRERQEMRQQTLENGNRHGLGGAPLAVAGDPLALERYQEARKTEALLPTMKCINKVQITELHNKQYTYDMVQNEITSLTGDFNAAVDHEAWRQAQRAEALQSMAENRQAKADYDLMHKKEWHYHMRNDTNERKRVAQLEVDRVAAVQARKVQINDEESIDTREALGAFEKRLERVVGVESNDEGQGDGDTARGESGALLRRQLVAGGGGLPVGSATAAAKLNKSSSSEALLNKLHAKAKEQEMAIRERDRRRRKVLVDQQRHSAKAEAAGREDAFLKRVIALSSKERQKAHAIWVARKRAEAQSRNESVRAMMDVDIKLTKQAQIAKSSESSRLQTLRNLGTQLLEAPNNYTDFTKTIALIQMEKRALYARTLVDGLVDLAFSLSKDRLQARRGARSKEEVAALKPVEQANDIINKISLAANWNEQVRKMFRKAQMQAGITARDSDSECEEAAYNQLHPPPVIEDDFVIEGLVVEEEQENPNGPLYPKSALFEEVDANRALGQTIKAMRRLQNDVEPTRADQLNTNVFLGRTAEDESKASTVSASTNNHLLMNLLQRVEDITTGKATDIPPPSVPTTPIGMCILGDVASGKRTLARWVVQQHRLKHLRLAELKAHAIAEYEKEEEDKKSKTGKKDKSSKKGDKTSKGSPLVALGQKAKVARDKGKECDDDLLVQLVIIAIRKVEAECRPPEPTDEGDEEVEVELAEDGQPKCGGWLLAGFPQTMAQMALLEKELTGYTSKGKKSAKGKDSSEPDKKEKSGIDLLIRLDLHEDVIRERCRGRTLNVETGEYEYGGTTDEGDEGGDSTEDGLEESIDAHRSEMIEMNEWFSKFSYLEVVDPLEPLREVSLHISSLVSTTVQNKKESEEDDEEDNDEDESSSSSDSDSDDSNDDHDGDDDDEEDEANENENTSEEEIDSVALAKFEAMFPQPDATTFYDRWNLWMAQYEKCVKLCFVGQRVLHKSNLQKLKEGRTHFLEELRSVDPIKTDCLAQFENQFNTLHPDVRSEPKAKAELTHRAQELSDMLWDLAEKRKDKMEVLLDKYKGDGWSQNRGLIVAFHYISIMQTELQRYRCTLDIIHDYYVAYRTKELSDSNTTIKLRLLPDKFTWSTYTGSPVELLKSCQKIVSEAIVKGRDLVKRVNASVAAYEKANEPEVVEEEEESLETPVESRSVSPSSRSASRATTSDGRISKSPPPPEEEVELPLVATGKYENAATHNLALYNAQIKELVKLENESFDYKLQHILQEGLDKVSQVVLYCKGEYIEKLDVLLGKRLEGESVSAERLLNTMQMAIDSEVSLDAPLVMEDMDVFVDNDVLCAPMKLMRLFNAPPPVRFSPPHLKALTKFCVDASEGSTIDSHDLQGVLLAFGRAQEGLPFGLDANTLPKLAKMFEDDSDNTGIALEWRQVILTLALPSDLSSPTLLQLLRMLDDCSKLDEAGTGFLSRVDFDNVCLWYESSTPSDSDKDISTTLRGLRDLFFLLFGEEPIQLSQREGAEIMTLNDKPMRRESLSAITEKMDVRASVSDQAELVLNYNQMLMSLCFNDQLDSGLHKAQMLEECSRNNTMTTGLWPSSQTRAEASFERLDSESYLLSL